jgi:hypothetical protein
MAITIQDAWTSQESTTAGGNGTWSNVTLTGTAGTGRLALIFVSAERNGGGPIDIDTVTLGGTVDFTPLPGAEQYVGSTGAYHNYHWCGFLRDADFPTGSQSLSMTWNVQPGTFSWVAYPMVQLVSYKGVDQGTTGNLPLVAAVEKNTSTGGTGSVTVSAFSTPTNGDQVILHQVIGQANNPALSSPSSGYTERGQLVTSASVNGLSSVAYSRDVTTAMSSTSHTFAQSSLSTIYRNAAMAFGLASDPGDVEVVVGGMTTAMGTVAVDVGREPVVGGMTTAMGTVAVDVGREPVVGGMVKVQGAIAKANVGREPVVGGMTTAMGTVAVDVGREPVVGGMTTAMGTVAVDVGREPVVGGMVKVQGAIAKANVGREPVVGGMVKVQGAAAVDVAREPVVGGMTTAMGTVAVDVGREPVVGGMTTAMGTVAVDVAREPVVGGMTTAMGAVAIDVAREPVVGGMTTAMGTVAVDVGREPVVGGMTTAMGAVLLLAADVEVVVGGMTTAMGAVAVVATDEPVVGGMTTAMGAVAVDVAREVVVGGMTTAMGAVAVVATDEPVVGGMTTAMGTVAVDVGREPVVGGMTTAMGAVLLDLFLGLDGIKARRVVLTRRRVIVKLTETRTMRPGAGRRVQLLRKD